MDAARRWVLTRLPLVILAAPRTVAAQATRPIPRVGIVVSSSPAAARHQIDAFREGLRKLGYVDRQSIMVEERWAHGKLERFTELICDLQRANVDVIVVG